MFRVLRSTLRLATTYVKTTHIIFQAMQASALEGERLDNIDHRRLDSPHRVYCHTCGRDYPEARK